MSQVSLPPGWGKDPMSEFIENARQNTFATFVNSKSDYKRLLDIDGAYRAIIDNKVFGSDWFMGVFLSWVRVDSP